MLKELVPIEWSDERVLTTKQLAEYYDTTTERVSHNFSENKEHFVEGVHYFKLAGAALRRLKKQWGFSTVAPPFSKMANCLYLWTVQGAARHAKMLRTPNVLEIFEQLRRDYFGEEKPKPVITPPKSDFPYFQPSQKSKAAFVDDNNVAQFDAEWIARQLGFVEAGKFSTRGENYVRWERLNAYLAEFGYKKVVGKGDLIPENMVYRLAMKANNEAAVKFQTLLADEIERLKAAARKPKPVITPPKSDFPYFQPSQKSKAAFVDDNNVAQFNAEWVARQLGWTQTQLKNGREYTSIRWERMNQYLAEFGFPQIVGEKDFIPENMLYRLIWKSHDDNALKFQSKVADEIMPSIRKYGYYSRYPESDKIMREVRESAERLMATTEKPVDTLPPFDPERARLLIDLCNVAPEPLKEQLIREIANFIYGKKLL